MMTTASMASPSNKCLFDDDEGPPSTPPLAPLRQRMGDEVAAKVPLVAEVAVPLVAEAAVPPAVVKKVVSVLQDDSNNDDEGRDSDGEGSGSDDLGKDNGESRDSNDGNGEGSGSEDSHAHPFQDDSCWDHVAQVPVCLREEYDSEAKVVLHAIDIIKQDAGSLNMVEWHRQVVWARRR
jgi:hypothetical protein